ncbi:hypothetical protein [Catellatospora citrea]|uniref:NhaP-type Na+/H+ or K+/H+ antiporter n=1 Tax=Catellatospora citrea TaxID=53366 RepID=A0A8J3KGW5_9ACTN|nr:hypothetical protein [Catellatospora citrea]RKE09864.1 hypothetical protein C8E86_4756 [Catellatospora citrea]GIG02738.1 hypothetical protein Cci01nite_78310 [Catellatospora citrea]
MRRLAWLALAVLIGLGAAAVTGVRIADATGSAPYLLATAALLAIGLYGSTYGIDVAAARQDRRLIVTAVTVGVVVKAAVIGAALALAWQDPLFLLLGIVVAQIDPLSVAALLGDDRLSPRARTVLAAWSSFDDPITVVLTVYAAAVATDALGLDHRGEQGVHVADGLAAYAVDLGLNLLFAGLVWLVWRFGVRDRPRWATALLALAAAVAVWQFLMLGLALVGLFLRPAWLERLLPRITQGALYAATVLLGLLLIGGIALPQGISLGVAAFAAQILVGWLLTRNMPPADRLHLAFAQQNGITAIILALRLEAQFAGVVAVVAPAILVTNLTHYAANHLLDRRTPA